MLSFLDEGLCQIKEFAMFREPQRQFKAVIIGKTLVKAPPPFEREPGNEEASKQPKTSSSHMGKNIPGRPGGRIPGTEEPPPSVNKTDITVNAGKRARFPDRLQFPLGLERKEAVVAVEKSHIIARNLTEGGISIFGNSDIFILKNRLDPSRAAGEVVPNQFLGAIRRMVIGHDDFIRRDRLVEDAFHRFEEVIFLIVSGNDDAHPGAVYASAHFPKNIFKA